MNFVQQVVTPEMAAEMLRHNVLNRRLNKTRVQTLISAIKNGTWTESPQPICFDKDGNLIDGQHRLEAIVRAEVPVIMTIATNVPSDAVIDKGLERDTASSLYMRGIIDKAVANREVLAIVNRYYSIVTVTNGSLVSDDEKGEFINRHRDNLLKSIMISRQGSHNCVCKRAGIQTAIFAALVCGIPEDVLIKFSSVANTGFMETIGQSSAVILRNFALEHGTSGASASNVLAACAQMAIKDFVDANPRRTKYKRKEHYYIEKMKTLNGEMNQ